MSISVAIIAPGEMGSFIGATLVAHGARVATFAEGRSEASLERARKAGFELIGDLATLVNQAEIILSIVPPDTALTLSRQLAPALSASNRKPIYVDCNAIAPQTVERISEVIEPTGSPFVDGGLFGGPTSGKPGAVLYVSGAHAGRVTPLDALGISVRIIDGSIGAASAMKLSFAAINKGFTAVAVIALLGALRTSSGPALIEQLAETQPAILQYISRFVPAMFPKSYRWAPEMEEIATFFQDDADAHQVFLGLGDLYRRVAADVLPNEHGMVPDLRAFCGLAAAACSSLKS